MEASDPTIDIVNAVLAKGLKCKRSGKEWKAQCPAHEDGSESLQIGYGDKGAVVHCHAGCTAEMVMGALGMTTHDMFADRDEKAPIMPSRAAAPGAQATYFYDDAAGNVLYRVERRVKVDKGKQTKVFLQARPDTHNPGQWIYNMGEVQRVPYRLQAVLGAIKAQEPIFIVEGEKDVHTLEENGFIGTTNPGGAGKFKREFAEFFVGAHVVIVPDNDQPGKAHADQVLEYLKDVARTISILTLPSLEDKGDVSDWFAAEGNTAEDFKLMADALTPLFTNKPTIFNAFDLMQEEFPEIVMAVPGVIAEGVTLLVGAPKIGKSWLSLQLGTAVAEGGMALGTIPVMQGKVLYLALEDTPRRLQRRLNVQLQAGVPAPRDLEFATVWPRLNAGGLDQLEAWIVDNPGARLIVIDTWAKIKSAVDGQSDSMYNNDYAAISAVKSLADKYGIAITIVHHQRKAADGDPLNTVAGSTGLTGAADATVILTRTRGSEDGTLYVTGRDVEETKSIVSFDGNTGQWTWLGEADDAEEQSTEQQIIKVLADAVPTALGPKEIADITSLKEGTCKWLVAKLATDGKIKRVGRGKYTVLDKDDAPSSGPMGSTQTAQASAVVKGAQPPFPTVGGAVIPMGPMTLTDDELEDMMNGGTDLRGDEDEDGFGDD